MPKDIKDIEFELDGEKITFRSFSELHDEWMQDPEYVKAYDALEWKYQLISALISARSKKGYSQEKLAQKLGTKQSAIARFESGRGNPTVKFIQDLSHALGLEVNISVKPTRI